MKILGENIYCVPNCITYASDDHWNLFFSLAKQLEEKKLYREKKSPCNFLEQPLTLGEKLCPPIFIHFFPYFLAIQNKSRRKKFPKVKFSISWELKSTLFNMIFPRKLWIMAIFFMYFRDLGKRNMHINYEFSCVYILCAWNFMMFQSNDSIKIDVLTTSWTCQYIDFLSTSFADRKKESLFSFERTLKI